MGDRSKLKGKGKTLHNSTNSPAMQNVSDLQKYGNCDSFKLISKASSQDEDWMKSTKALEIPGVGCVVQVTTQQGKHVAEALAFVPGVRIDLIGGDKKNGRRLVQLNAPSAIGDVPENWPTRGQPIQDSLPAQGVAEIVDGINARHAKSKQVADLTESAGPSPYEQLRADVERYPSDYAGVFNRRRRASYHDMMRFDGTDNSACAIIEWVNGTCDLCRAYYDNSPSTTSIAIQWDGEHPAAHVNRGDFVVSNGNGSVSLRSETQALTIYDIVLPRTSAESACVDTPVRVVEHRYNEAGAEVYIHYYDGTPESAGVIVNAALRCSRATVCYGRNGLSVYCESANTKMREFIVAPDQYVVLDGDVVVTGTREWLDTAYPA